MSAEFTLTETGETVAWSFASRDADGNRCACLEVCNLDNAARLRTALEMGFEVRTADGTTLSPDGALTLDLLDELVAAGRVTLGRYGGTVEVGSGDLFRLAPDACPDTLEGLDL